MEMKGFPVVLLLQVLLLAVAGCVHLAPEGGPGDSRAITGSVFGALDPGAKSLDSLHFRVSSYGIGKTRDVSELCERLYQRIMGDTALYSFMPRGLYNVFVYGSKEEYQRKSGMPEWSGGASVGNSIYAFDSRGFPGILAHEMTHLVFHEFMGSSDPLHRWVNEGLAVYEEQEALLSIGVARAPPPSRMLPFREMIHLAPLGESGTVAGDWYTQVGGVVRFMIERGGRVGFGEFLKGLRRGLSVDDAVRGGFPGVWGGLSDLENAWRDGR